MKYSREKREGFWSKVDMSAGPDACWSWKGGVYQSGYGTAYWDGCRGRRAHRVAYQLTFGDIPKGAFICHVCDNRLCANPSHLFLGSHQDNMRDMFEKGRANRSRVQVGERNSAAKLTAALVLRIRELFSQGISVTEISKCMNVPYSNAWLVANRKTWTHI